MRHHVLICIVLNLVTNIISYNALGISSKLDFDSSDSSAKLIGSGNTNKFKSTSYRQVKIEEVKPEEKLENIGVVCTSGKECNISKSNQVGDTIETDVIVHVKTTVDSNRNNKSNVMDDTPDVPIIIGTDDNKYADNQNVIANSRDLVVTTSGDKLFEVNPIVPITPAPLLGSYQPVGLQTGNLYTQKYNFFPSEPRVDINVEPSVSFKMRQNDFNYNTGGIELQIPRFEPSYHRHYFNENGPPQVLWYPKNSGYDSKPTRKPSSWTVGVVASPTHKHRVEPGVTCSCKNEVPRGLQWYPKGPTYRADPGSEINDKLAPLA